MITNPRKSLKDTNSKEIYCVKVLRKTKMEYFQDIDVNDNKMFWKTVKPRFSNKCKTASTIILTEGDMLIKNEKLISDPFNNYFVDITKTLKLKKHPNFDGQSLFSITVTSKTMKV